MLGANLGLLLYGEVSVMENLTRNIYSPVLISKNIRKKVKTEHICFFFLFCLFVYLFILLYFFYFLFFSFLSFFLSFFLYLFISLFGNFPAL